jgi:hypothetical protein
VRISLLGLVAVGLVALSACSGSKGESISATPTDPALSGRFFSTAGESSANADLYDGRFASGHLLLYRLTTTHRVGGIGGCDSKLTVTNADQTVGLTDTVQNFDAGTFSPIAGLSDPKGSVLAVGPDCRLIFARPDRSTDPPTDHLILFDPSHGTSREVYTPGAGKVLGAGDWGPGGKIAIIEGTTPTEGHPTVVTGIVVIGADGSKRTIASPISALGTLQWGLSKWIALSDEANGRTVFLDVDSGAHSELAGWFPLAWSPDGQHLMVTDPATRRTLGLVDVTNLASARVVGHTRHIGFYDFVWLPDNATAVGPPPALPRRPDDGD